MVETGKIITESILKKKLLLNMTQDIENCLIFGSAASAMYISRSENRFPTQKEVYAYAKRYYELPHL